MRPHWGIFVASFGIGFFFLATALVGQEQELATFLEQQRIAGRLPGLAAAVVDDRGFHWEIGLGWAELEVRPVAPDTPFLVASVSKPVTATALMAAVEDGVLTLDGDIRGGLPFSVVHPFHPDAPITARQLLAHASSIVDDPARLAAAIAPGDPTVSLQDFLALYLAPGELRSWSSRPPASAFSYSNVGYALAGEVLEVGGSESFAAFVERRLFAPLGLTDSAWSLAALPRPAAVPYRATSAGFAAYEPYGAPYGPAVMLRASARDLGRFLAFHLARGRVGDRQVLAAESIAEMERIQFPLSGLQALGWRYLNAGGRLVLGHGGSGSGVTAEIVLDRRRGRGVALLTNVDATEGAAARAFQAVLDRLLTETEFPSTEAPPPAPRTWLLPSVIRGHRGGDVEYRTDLWLVNPNGSTLTVEVEFRPRGAGAAPSTVSVTLAAGEVREIPDALVSLFGRAAGQGAFAFEVGPTGSATPSVTALARIAPVDGPGQWVGAEEPALAVGERWLAGVHQGDGFAATVSVQNAENAAQTVEIEAWDAGGAGLGRAVLALTPNGVRTLRLDALLPATARGGGPFTLRFLAPGRFLASATLLEAGSTDAFHLPAALPGPELGSVLVPRVVRGRGQRGALLATELALHNPADSEVALRLEWWRRGRENATPDSVTVTVPPRSTRVWPDVLGALFPAGGADAAGALVISNQSEGPAPVVSALGLVRTSAGARLGTPIGTPVGRSGNARRAFGAGWGLGRDSSVGLVNESAGATSVELVLLDDRGAELGRKMVFLGLRQHLERTLPGLFGELAPGRGWTVTARAPMGDVVTLYVSSLDERGDPDLLVAGVSPDGPTGGSGVE
jgi:CubicO group peptidase (beta-lactamase class C family)